jgi:hypothetical protein
VHDASGFSILLEQANLSSRTRLGMGCRGGLKSIATAQVNGSNLVPTNDEVECAGRSVLDLDAAGEADTFMRAGDLGESDGKNDADRRVRCTPRSGHFLRGKDISQPSQ